MWRPTLADYVGAAAVLEVPETQVQRLPGLTLAESALAAPFAGFGGQDAYPSLDLKAAILLERLVGNHPLPDGNKRTGFAVAIRFLERNGRRWGESATSIDVEMVRRIAARTVELEEIAAWIGQRTERPS